MSDPLLTLHDDARDRPFDGAGIQAALDFVHEAFERGADPDWDRPRLVRFLRAQKGGLATFEKYGKPYYRALARSRRSETVRAALPELRAILATHPAPAPATTPAPACEQALVAQTVAA